MKLLPVIIIAVFSAPSIVQAQQTWVVDDQFSAGADFLDIQTAVDFVSDGDTLLIREGTYGGFIVDAKELSILSDGNGIPNIQGGVIVRNLGLGRELRLVGLTIQALTDNDGIHATNMLGALVLNDCEFIGGHGDSFSGAYLQDCDSVTFLSCTLSGGPGGNSGRLWEMNGGSGIHSIDSNLYLLNTTVTGETGSTDTTFIGNGGVGGTGVQVEGGFLGCHDSDLGGGPGGNGFGGFAIGCGDGGNGGDALRLDLGQTSGAPVADLNSTPLVAGAHGLPAQQCWPGVDGQDVVVVAGVYNTYAEPGADLRITRPFRSGEVGFVSVLGNPGDIVQMAVSNGASPAWDSVTQSPTIPSNGTNHAIGTIPAWGILSMPIQIQLPTGVLSKHYVIQVVSGPSGGMLRPGAAAVLTVVDSRY